MSILLAVLGLILFVLLVVIHEMGHFFAARRNGVDVEEFGIGFPPKAKTLAVKNGTEYTLNWLPLGGFVRLKGENDSATEKGTYGAASLKTKVKIMLAGVTMNLLAAFVILTILAWAGIPKLVDNQFTVDSDTRVKSSKVLAALVLEESPAASAGIESQDEIVGYRLPNQPLNELSESGEPSYSAIQSSKELSEMTERLAGQSIDIVFIKDGAETSKTVQLLSKEEVEESKNSENPKGYLGIVPTEYILQQSTWSAPIVAGGLIKQFTELTLGALGNMVVNLFLGNTAEATRNIAGPVGIFVLIKNGAILGYEFILMIIAIISLTLAIMNALPIPALDGGRLWVTLGYRIFKKPLTKEAEEKIHGTGFAALMILFVLITIVDVRRFF